MEPITKTCSICLETYEQGSRGILQHTNHGFHIACLRPWVKGKELPKCPFNCGVAISLPLPLHQRLYRKAIDCITKAPALGVLATGLATLGIDRVFGEKIAFVGSSIAIFLTPLLATPLNRTDGSARQIVIIGTGAAQIGIFLSIGELATILKIFTVGMGILGGVKAAIAREPERVDYLKVGAATAGVVGLSVLENGGGLARAGGVAFLSAIGTWISERMHLTLP